MQLIRRYDNSAAQRPVPPEVALLVSTYQRPRHLRLSLASIALQQGVSEKLELVVTDDGSTDETFEIVEQFAATVDFPVTLTTHPHGTFQLAQCRNEGAAASTAPYLLFTDGDLILPPDFVWQNLQRRRRNSVYTGKCLRLAQDVSAGIDEALVQSGAYRDLVSPVEVRRVRWSDRRARLYALLRHPRKPHIFGNNIGIWRSDYERVNGFDENYQGWGFEDFDLGLRLRRLGVRIRWINRWTCAYHVWHPRDPTAPTAIGPNVAYYYRQQRPDRCLNGLIKLGPATGPTDGASPSSDRAVVPLSPAPSDEADGRRCAA